MIRPTYALGFSLLVLALISVGVMAGAFQLFELSPFATASTTTTTQTRSVTTTQSQATSGYSTTDTSESSNLASIVPQSAGGYGSSPLGLIVPLYMGPGPDWNTLIAAKEAYPMVPVIAIINPSNGPGSSLNVTYASYTSSLAAAGILIAGYVDTMEMNVSLSSVEQQMDQYRLWYPQTALIFLDDVPDNYSSSFGSYYSVLSAYAHSLGLSTIGNPGWAVSAPAYSTVNDTMYYETNGLPSLSYLQGAASGLPNSRFSFIATSVPSLPSQSYFDSVARYAAFVYISNQDPSYGDLPTYLMQEMYMLSAS